jgi:hypothetical protein
MKRLLILGTVLVCFLFGQAQLPYNASFLQLDKQKELKPTDDSKKWSDPKKATVLSLVLPGAGQIYNKRYWKAGLVYAGAGGLFYMFKMNSDSLDRYQAILTAKIDGDSNTVDLYPDASETSIKNFRDFHRRYRDVAILGFVGLYALQAIDANVDGHLKEFRVNKDLSLKVSPRIYGYQPGAGYYHGMAIQLKLH